MPIKFSVDEKKENQVLLMGLGADVLSGYMFKESINARRDIVRETRELDSRVNAILYGNTPINQETLLQLETNLRDISTIGAIHPQYRETFSQHAETIHELSYLAPEEARAQIVQTLPGWNDTAQYAFRDVEFKTNWFFFWCPLLFAVASFAAGIAIYQKLKRRAESKKAPRS